ncbi:MAG: tRNA (adenosine(37)-N6)-threonylcarbamoyltransferase complex ATPase subunit type 1 TsaE [Bacteriovoracaceae bacterium]
MSKKILKSWKKVFKNDLNYVVGELKTLVTPPAVLILTGEMGAGKTTFVQYFAGSNLKLNSPTFSILNETKTLLHGDFYRLEKPTDLPQLELEIYLEDKEYFLVEWGRAYIKQLKAIVPEEFLFYELEIEVEEGSTDTVEGAYRNYNLVKL